MEILLKPIVTEKMTAQSEKLNKYGFLVERTANRVVVKQAVEEMYGVTVEAVNIIRYGGKPKSRFTKAGVLSGKTNASKKAIVTLVEGDTIDFYSNI